ncbi:radical SAM protein, partial [Enterococcus faecalis]
MKYLFIRIHEACNAGCWFCSFAKSNDQFRLSIEKFHEILNECIEQKVDYIRFTGGEPLLDNNLNYFIEQANAAKIKTSVITNGLMLSKKADSLAKSGLNQIIVSLDDLEKEHDNNRDIKNLFIKSIRGLSECKKFGIKTRVNTVCGPHNFKSMPKLQEIFTEIGVDYWELSALKLDSKIEYDTSEKEIQKIINHIYYEDHGLKPFGKIWCGNTKTEQKNYFLHSLPPRVTKDCSMP